MLASRACTLALLTAAVVASPTSAGLAGAGDWTLRAATGYFAPTADATTRSAGFSEFTDLRFPPQGRMDLVRSDRFEAQGDLGLSLELERTLGDHFGISATLGYTDLVTEATLSGDATFTPYVGEPLAPAPTHTRSGSIRGGATGRVRLVTLTLGASLHLLRTPELDVHLGPLIGLAVPEPRFEHGTMLVSTGLVSTTRLEGAEADATFDPALGALLGIDRRLGRKGWLLSVSARYLWTGGLNPTMLQLGLGYRF